MSTSTSVLTELLQAVSGLRTQMYFKSSLTALSHAMEDQVLAGSEHPLLIASFQKERFYRQEAHRYRRIAQKTDQVYVLSAPETEFKNGSNIYETIAFAPTDGLAFEWHLVIVGQQYACCLICQERTSLASGEEPDSFRDNNRRFDGVWTFDRQISAQAAGILLERIVAYRPELTEKVEQARRQYLEWPVAESNLVECCVSNPTDPFIQRLVTYLQAGQYKLIKANHSLAIQQQREQLINQITTAIRRSLDPEEILQVAVEKLGGGLDVCRCIVYRCKESDNTATINHEYLGSEVNSTKGQTWPLKENFLFQEAATQKEPFYVADISAESHIGETLSNLTTCYFLVSWLLVPVLYQDKLLGMVELHNCQPNPADWKKEDIILVNAIATQIGVALIQAEAYANLEDLNQQLEALDRTRSNLVAITGHELRTPLSTIQVCLESLASEPDMSSELRQVMLNTALNDAERMRKLIQDFLTLSQLESGRIEWHPEPLSLEECIDLALSHVRARNLDNDLPEIKAPIPPGLPLVQADGEWLVEVLAKLLDNACKFTSSDGQVTVQVGTNGSKSLEVTVADTGRGIEPNRLETVFDRFYQEEGALRRSAGGTGLGLAICRQIVNGWGGEIWAESPGRNQGSQFHFTIPTVGSAPTPQFQANGRRPKSKKRKQRSKSPGL